MNISMTIANMNTDEALHIAKAAAQLGEGDQVAKQAPAVDPANGHTNGNGAKTPKLDASKLDAIAASSKPVAKEKPPTKKQLKEEAEGFESLAKSASNSTEAAGYKGLAKKAREEAESAEDEEEDIPFPETPKAKVKAKPAPEPEEEEDADDEEEEAPKPKAKASANGKEKPLPEAILNARKLRDVLAFMMDKGITDPEDLKAECARIKDRVPALQRIADLDSRIDRTLEVMEMGDDVS